MPPPPLPRVPVPACASTVVNLATEQKTVLLVPVVMRMALEAAAAVPPKPRPVKRHSLDTSNAGRNVPLRERSEGKSPTIVPKNL